MSYRSITAATPIRNSPSSPRRSTRTTLPKARTNTSVLCVISAGNVRVMSSSEPASKSWSITKYSPRVEMSRVLPFWFSFGRSVGILTITGKDKSYRRALRRSDIKLIPHPIRGQNFRASPLLSFRHYYLKNETCDSSSMNLSAPNPLVVTRNPDQLSLTHYRATLCCTKLLFQGRDVKAILFLCLCYSFRPAAMGAASAATVAADLLLRGVSRLNCRIL